MRNQPSRNPVTVTVTETSSRPMLTGGGRRATGTAAGSGVARNGWPFSSRSFDQPSKRHSTVPSGRDPWAEASPLKARSAIAANAAVTRLMARIPSQSNATVAQQAKLLQDGRAIRQRPGRETGMDDLTLAAEFPAATREAWL